MRRRTITIADPKQWHCSLGRSLNAGGVNDGTDGGAPAGQRTVAASELYRHDWVVYAKTPLGGPAQVLEYLSRYTHRTAIGNERIPGHQPDAGGLHGARR